MSTLPLSTIVDVTSTIVGFSQIKPGNPNQLLFLTTETPSDPLVAPWQYFIDAQTVGKAYGTQSTTYRMASLLFSQAGSGAGFPQGNGSLAIAPMLSSVSAKGGIFKTKTITSTIVNKFKTVKNGVMSFSIDATPGIIQNLDFTSVVTVADISRILQDALIQYATISTDASVPPAIVFQSNTAGASSAFTLSTTTTPPAGAIDITGVDYLDIATGIATPGDACSGETIQQAAERLKSLTNAPQFFTIFTNLILDFTSIIDAATYAQSSPDKEPLEIIYAFQSRQAILPTGPATGIVTKGFSKFRMLLHFTDRLGMLAAYIGRLFSVDFNLPSSAQSGVPAGDKRLTGISPVSVNLTDLENVFIPAGVTMYISVGGSPGLFRPSGANGGYDDNISGADRIILELQNAIATYMSRNIITTNQNGEAILQTILESVMIQAVRCGLLTPDINWNSPVPIGIPSDKYDKFYESIFTRGFYVYVAPFSSRTPLQVANRLTGNLVVAGMQTGTVNKVFINLYQQQN